MQIGTAFAPRISRIWETTEKKLAPVRSILFTKQMRGTLYFVAWCHTVSDWGSTPPTAQKRPIAPSRMRRERSTSTVKSTCPGVSMMLIMLPFQMQVVAALMMVMPRSFSSSMKSIVAEPSWVSPSLWVRPV